MSARHSGGSCGLSAGAALACLLVTPSSAFSAEHTQAESPAASPASAKPDLSGRKRVGKASFYADKFAGRKMADGQRMDPRDDNAASKTLPLGTKARDMRARTSTRFLLTMKLCSGPGASGTPGSGGMAR